MTYLDVKHYARFIAKIDLAGKSHTDCWEWTGTKLPHGYGQFRVNGETKLCHRIAYKHWKGAIGAGLQINHHCDNPCCVNPDHLYAGTPKENSDDMVRRNRHQKGEQKSCSVFTEKDIPKIRAEISSGKSMRQIARNRGVSYGAIQKINNGETWSWVK